MAGPVAALAVAAPLALVLGIEAEMEQRILVRGRYEVDIAAAAAVAAARTAVRDILLAAKGETAVSAVSRLYVNPDFIDKHGGCRFETGRVPDDRAYFRLLLGQAL